MDDLKYKIVRSITKIEVLPRELHKNLMKIITRRMKDFYECKCDPHLGYIKKNSIVILKKSEGMLRQNSFTGSFLFNIEFECLAIKPLPGDNYYAIINKKNDSGLFATSFNLPFNIFILKDFIDDPEEKKLIDEIEEKVVIEIEVIKAELNIMQGKYNVTALLKRTVASYKQDFPIIFINSLDISSVTISKQIFIDTCDDYVSIKNCKLLKNANQNIGLLKNKTDSKLLNIRHNKLIHKPTVSSLNNGKKFWRLIKNIIHTYSTLEDHTIYWFKEHIVSRAFYKMLEILNNFPLLQDKNMSVLNLAESPGGFVQAILYNRNLGTVEPYIDNYCVMSIPEGGKSDLWDRADGLIDKLTKSKKYFGDVSFVPNEDKITISFSDLHNGDVMKDGCHAYLDKHYASHKADLITADGAFGFNESEDDYQNQETRHYGLFISEIMLALAHQNEGGCFVLKVFDLFTDTSIKLIAILSYCYSSVKVFKPTTSRQANSEKYIICLGFKTPDNISGIIDKLKLAIYELRKYDTFTEELYPGAYGIGQQDQEPGEEIVSSSVLDDADASIETDDIMTPSVPMHFLNVIFDFEVNIDFVQNIRTYNDKFVKNEYDTIISGLDLGNEILAIKDDHGIAACNKFITDKNIAKIFSMDLFIKTNNLPKIH